MQYSIPNDKLIDVMLKFLKDLNFFSDSPTLEKKVQWGEGNSGYGSEMQDYRFTTTYYYDSNGKLVFKEYSDRNPTSEVRWMVDEDFEPLFDFFGEEVFELFIERFYGLDIKNKGDKDMNWIFDT